MKFCTEYMYNYLINSNKTNTIILNNDLINYKASQNYLIKTLEPFKFYLDNFTNINVEQLKNLKEYSRVHLRINNQSKKLEIDIERLNKVLLGISEINKSIIKIEKELKIKDFNLSLDVYKKIIYKFNEKISDEIVYKGYTLNLPFNLGKICIKKVEISEWHKKRINWNKSNINKKELLLQGKIPFKVTLRDDKKVILEDNGGIKWLEYYTQQFDYLWNWKKKDVKVTNCQYFKFRPTLYNNTVNGGKLGNINKLKQLVTSNSDLLKMYNT